MSKYYIARDKTDGLWLFNEKPVKGENHWALANGDRGKLIRQNLFSEVRWEDKEPKVLTIADNSWIKVEDRLPADGEEVLQLNRMKHSGELFYMVNSYKDGRWFAHVATYYDIIAWRPIPKYEE